MRQLYYRFPVNPSADAASLLDPSNILAVALWVFPLRFIALQRYFNGCVSLLVQAKMNGSEAFRNLLKKEIRNRNPSPNEHDVRINLVKSAYVKRGNVITLEHYDLETNYIFMSKTREQVEAKNFCNELLWRAEETYVFLHYSSRRGLKHTVRMGSEGGCTTTNFVWKRTVKGVLSDTVHGRNPSKRSSGNNT